MPANAAACSDEAFAFIECLDHIETTKRIIDVMMRSLAYFGIEHFIVTGLPNYRERFEQSVLLRKWPVGWFELYARKDYVRVDPVIRHCRETVQPFEWTEALYDPERDTAAREVMERASDFGLRRGFSLPVHGLQGQTTCFSMSGPQPDLTQRAKPSLHLMAMYAFERIRQIAGPVRIEVANPLTKREQEVLKWAAVGKSSVDVSTVLGISPRTVTAHTVNAMQKLGASNRTHAVARAITEGFIKI